MANPRFLAALAALVITAGCSSEPDSQPAPSPQQTEPPVAQASPAPLPSMRTPVDAPAPGTALPPVGTERRYVGRWAASAKLCRAGAWVFTRDHLATAGEVSCDFTEVSEAPGGYDIAARCTADAPPKDDTIKLRFAESAQAMLVEGSKTFADTGLIYCGAE